MTSEIVPLRPTDERVVRVRDLMIQGRWNADMRDQLCAETGLSRSVWEHAAEEAGRFLRIQRAPGMLLEQALAELRAIAADQASAAPAVAVAAWKTILDQIGKLVDRAAAGPQPDRTQALRATLLDPPPELLALLLEWLEGAAGGAAVSEVLERNGWRRG